MRRRFADGSAATENRPAARERPAGFLLQERLPFAGDGGRPRLRRPAVAWKGVEIVTAPLCGHAAAVRLYWKPSAVRERRAGFLLQERLPFQERFPFAGAVSFCGRRRADARPLPRRRVEGGGDRDCSALRPCRSRSAAGRPPHGKDAPASFCRSGFLFRSGFLLQERFPFAGDGGRTRVRCPAAAPNGRRTPGFARRPCRRGKKRVYWHHEMV